MHPSWVLEAHGLILWGGKKLAKQSLVEVPCPMLQQWQYLVVGQGCCLNGVIPRMSNPKMSNPRISNPKMSNAKMSNYGYGFHASNPTEGNGSHALNPLHTEIICSHASNSVTKGDGNCQSLSSCDLAVVSDNSVFKSSVISDINSLRSMVCDLRQVVHWLRSDRQPLKVTEGRSSRPCYLYIRLKPCDSQSIGKNLLESTLSCKVDNYWLIDNSHYTLC